jgi:hypothetical protein
LGSSDTAIVECTSVLFMEVYGTGKVVRRTQRWPSFSEAVGSNTENARGLEGSRFHLPAASHQYRQVPLGPMDSLTRCRYTVPRSCPEGSSSAA